MRNEQVRQYNSRPGRMYVIFDGEDKTGKHITKSRWIANEDMEAILSAGQGSPPAPSETPNEQKTSPANDPVGHPDDLGRSGRRGGGNNPSGDRPNLAGIPVEQSEEPGVETNPERLVPPEPQASVEPVPQSKLRLVHPVPQSIEKAGRASGSTPEKRRNVHPVPHKPKSLGSNRMQPPTIPGHKWKPSGKTGWELYTREPAISATGKRSSKGKYIAYYSQEAIERMNREREKTTNTRSTQKHAA